MNNLTQNDIQNIRSSVDIVDVISSYIKLTNRGKNYFGVCPFHDDHSPSMSVSKEKQIYTCFSCGATGNVFNFIMDYENVPFLEAVKIVATKAGIDFKYDLKSQVKKDKNSELYEIYDVSLKFYQNNIQTKAGIEAKEYLKKRDIDENVIKEFGIGLSLTERDLLSKILLKKKYEDKFLIQSGLILKNEYGYVDMYYNRIMFPLWDLNGQVVGYSGRIFHGEDTSKYINTKETEIFKKGQLLYNYHRAKEEARRKQTVIVMEGFMDVIRAYTVDVLNVVATMGTAVTKEQALLLKKLAKDIILCFDGDSAGAKATFSCINELEKIGVVPKVVRLEEDLDPDEYIKKYGKEAFLNKIANPINVMDFKLSYYKKNKDLSNPLDVSNYVKSLLTDLGSFNDDILKEATLQKISKETNLDINFLKSQLANMNTPKEENMQPVIVHENYDKYQKAEQALIYYMLKNKTVIKAYNKKITFMPTNSYRKLAQEISLFYKNYGYINVADFLSEIASRADLVKALSEILQLPLKEEFKMEEIDDYLNAIREYNVNEEVKRLTAKMNKETEPLKKAIYAQKILDLKVRSEEE